GGSILLNGSSLNFNGTLTLKADAALGKGGSISVTLSGLAADLFVQNSVNPSQPQIVASAKGVGNQAIAGDGGSVTFAAGQSLTVDPSAVTAGPSGPRGKGANFHFESGVSSPGILTVTSGLSANGI